MIIKINTYPAIKGLPKVGETIKITVVKTTIKKVAVKYLPKKSQIFLAKSEIIIKQTNNPIKNNNEYSSKIIKIEKDKITVILEENFKRKIKNRPVITLFFSLLKGDKNEMIIQKCTEIGIDKFVPVKTKNSVPKIDNSNKKILR